MNLGLNLGIGVGAGGAVLPADRSELLWWGTGTSDGETIDDRVGTLDAVEVGGVNCLALDGVGDKVNIPAITGFDGGNPKSMSCDFKVTALPSAATLMGVYSGATGGRFQLLAETTTRMSVAVTGGFRKFTVPNLADGAWHTVLVKAPTNSTADIELYLDGNSMSEQSVSVQTINTAAGEFRLGYAVGSVELFNGEIANVKVCAGAECDTVIAQYPIQEGSGTVVYDVSDGNNDGTIVPSTTPSWTTSDDIFSYNLLYGFSKPASVYIPALLDGTLAADGSAITNKGGHVHNGCEVTLTMTDPEILDSIEITIDGATADLDYLQMTGGKPHYQGVLATKTVDVSWSTGDSKWELSTFPGDVLHPTASGYFPPKTGWPLPPTTDSVSIAYNCWWISSEEFAARTYADFVARVNGNDKQIDKWGKETLCVAKESVVYPQDYEETVNWLIKGMAWSGDKTCNAGWVELLYDVGGDIIYDDDGYPILVQPE